MPDAERWWPRRCRGDAVALRSRNIQRAGSSESPSPRVSISTSIRCPLPVRSRAIRRLQHRLGDDGRGSEIEMRQMAEHLAAAVSRVRLFRTIRRTTARSDRCRPLPPSGRRARTRKPRHRSIRRIQPCDNVVAKPEAFDRARPHVLHEDVALLDDLERDRSIGLVLEVQLNHALVVIARKCRGPSCL